MSAYAPLRVACLLVASLGTMSAQAQGAPRAVQVYAAGSLRTAFEELSRAFEQDHPVKVGLTFGASGLLKDRIVAGESRREQGALQVLAVPEAINVSARYGLALLAPAGDDARAYAHFLLGPKGQAILAAHGFSAP